MIVLCIAFPIFCSGGQPGTKLTISLERVPDPPGQDTVTLKATVKNVSKESVLINVWHRSKTIHSPLRTAEVPVSRYPSAARPSFRRTASAPGLQT
jgi:hypothetical protein